MLKFWDSRLVIWHVLWIHLPISVCYMRMQDMQVWAEWTWALHPRRSHKGRNNKYDVSLIIGSKSVANIAIYLLLSSLLKRCILITENPSEWESQGKRQTGLYCAWLWRVYKAVNWSRSKESVIFKPIFSSLRSHQISIFRWNWTGIFLIWPLRLWKI